MGRSMREDRKGYFFLIDAFLAMSILALGMLLMYSFHTYRPHQVQPVLLADDVMESLSSNKVDDLAGNRSGINVSRAGIYVSTLRNNGNITNMQNTLLEQIGEFYALGNHDLARGFAINITERLVPAQYGFGFYLNDSDLNITVNNIDIPPNESAMLVTSRRVVAGILNETVMWGPIVMEARVWL